jgi:hypothetical protein
LQEQREEEEGRETTENASERRMRTMGTFAAAAVVVLSSLCLLFDVDCVRQREVAFSSPTLEHRNDASLPGDMPALVR